ncbi:Uncharacterized protein ChrSV_3104 [Chromobacterium vaccinii]|nr:Uncharacterized protein ChrSW_3104 [Chromobacterium vaccinii]QND90561.1 Uncharacterized protein ChrSV_3104 [Chromobacterium vaccinii]
MLAIINFVHTESKRKLKYARRAAEVWSEWHPADFLVFSGRGK